MRLITATEANRDFSKLLEQVANGDSVNITKHGEIVATLIPAMKNLKSMEEEKRKHIEALLSRKPFAPVSQR
ncbi:MAG: type II toxin-antitoxin system prevent-host-death family antitoxin, partial [Alphaproteobacteria bacterium]|nr:type II toxin-antitoxin system prevent-host-death family antitoxin [Alphaproteobacteria bacterium]